MSDAAALREALTGSTTESLAVRREVLPFALAALARLEAALALVTRERDEGDAGYEVASKAWNENQARIKELEAERGQP